MEHHLLKYLGSYNLFFIIGFKKKKKFIYLWLCQDFIAVPGLLIAMASLVAEQGLQ